MPNTEEDIEQQEASFIAGGNMKMALPLFKTIHRYLENLNILLP